MGSVFTEDNYSAQPYVLTTSVRRFMAGGRMLLDTNNRPSAMGIATGVPGVGKTVAQHMLQAWLKSGKPSIQCIAVKVPPRSTPIVLAEQIFAVLNVSHRVRRVSGLADALAQAFHQHGLQLLLLDQADHLNDACLDLLCHLTDTTACAVFMVGLDEFLQRSLSRERLEDRVVIRLNFQPPAFEEVLHVQTHTFAKNRAERRISRRGARLEQKRKREDAGESL